MASSKKVKEAPAQSVRVGPSPDDAHDVVYFKRHAKDDPEQAEPGRDALQSWPPSVRAKAYAVLIAVATAPPKRFAGGGYWEAMKGGMSGWFEVRIDGPRRHHYRLFCLLDYEARGKDKPLLVVIDGRDKPFRTALSDADYAAVRAMGGSTSSATRARSVEVRPGPWSVSADREGDVRAQRGLQCDPRAGAR